MSEKITLEALKTKTGNYFVFFFDYYGAYFNSELNAFVTGNKKMNPWRADAVGEWNNAKENWDHTPETIKLTWVKSEELLKIVESDNIDGIPNVREKTKEYYL